MKYVSELIGDDYLSWKDGERILISSQTGSGKSMFILQKLLPHAISQQKKIAYLCNRRVLRDQLNEEASIKLKSCFGTDNLTEEEKSHIIITTYQACQTQKLFPDFKQNADLSKYSKKEIEHMKYNGILPLPIRIPKSDVMYYVYDEAHYFLGDALFNEDTNYWYSKNFDHGIHVFLTATPELLKIFLGSHRSINAKLRLPSKQPIFDEHRLMLKIHSSLAEESAIRNQPKYTTIYHEKPTGTDFRHPKFSVMPEEIDNTKAIADQARLVKPFTPIYEYLDTALTQNQLFQYVYPPEQHRDFSYLDVKYFNEYKELFPLIKGGEDKWLIFVDNESAGNELTKLLNDQKIPSVFLSASQIDKKGTKSYSEFVNIVCDKQFSCKVLVSMSVIDCGVSISDEQLKHIAICQTDKTTFLQMIGRKRVNEGMRVTLYICNQPPTKMNSRKNLCIRKLRLLIGIYLLNEHENKQTGTPTKYHDGLTEVSILTDNPKNAVVQAIAHGKAEHLIYSQGEQLQLGRKHYQDEKPSDLLKEFRYSKTAFLALAYQLQNYAAAVEECRVDYRKTYLKRQLSWIDREYDESLWVTYQSTRDELVKFLDEYVVDNKVLWKSDQMAFRKKCHKLFLKFPDKPDYCHKMYGEAPPSKMRLNEAFIEKKIPFTIVAKQSSSAGRKTYWKITRT